MFSVAFGPARLEFALIRTRGTGLFGGCCGLIRELRYLGSYIVGSTDAIVDKFLGGGVNGWRTGCDRFEGKKIKTNRNETTESNNNASANLSGKAWMQAALAKVAAEDWWSECENGKRVLAWRIAQMMEELLAEGRENKRIEIRLEAKAVRVRWIHVLEKPEKGCLSAIVLPEVPAGRWN